MDGAAELVRICHMVHERGLVVGSGGNISILVSDDRILITPTGRSLGLLTEDDLVAVDLDGRPIGSGTPSKEVLLHTLAYKARSDCRSVVHVHSPHAVAVSCLKELDATCAVPIYTPGYKARVGCLEAIPFFPPGSKELAMRISEVVGHRNSVLLRNHGLITIGASLELAVNLAEEIEENCRIFFLLRDDGCELGA